MKTWTVVVEIKDAGDSLGHVGQKRIEEIISERLHDNLPAGFSFQIFETTEAPYGPQGVYLAEHKIGRAGRVKTAPILTCSKTCKPLGVRP